MTNGDVQAAVQVGNTLYIGGTFTRVAPASDALGSFFGVSTATGDALPSFPLVDGLVHATAPDGAGGYYIGGEFTRVDGVARTNLAHIFPDGSVDMAFAATATGGAVTTVARGTALVFIGGSFRAVNGADRFGFAAVDPTTGSVVTFAGVTDSRKLIVAGAHLIAIGSQSATAFTQAGGVVWTRVLGAVDGQIHEALVVGTRLIVAGYFGDNRPLISLDVATGIIDEAWLPTVPPLTTAHAITTAGDALYAAGTTYTGAIGVAPQPATFAVTVSTGAAINWTPAPNGPVSTLVASTTGTVFLGGLFSSLGGSLRDRFGEVDATGTPTPWVADASASNPRTMHVDGAGTLLIGAQTGVRGGSARTRLAAFDLESNTLLPWAPPMPHEIEKLAAVGNSIYVGHVIPPVPPGVTPQRRILAVDGVSGATLPWTPPENVDLSLLGADATYVYVSGALSLRRLGASTGIVDPGWRPALSGASAAVISGRAMYLASGPVLKAVDVETGTLSPWNPAPLPNPGPTSLDFRAVAVDGRTVLAAVTDGGFLASRIVAVDGETAVPTTGPILEPPTGFLRGFAVADGQLILGAATIKAFHASGQPSAWNPGLRPIQSRGPSQNLILVTPTDVIVLGHEGANGPVQGIAVLPRTPALAPTSLRATTVDNEVSLAWNTPTPPPATEYLLDVAATAGSANPVTLPTGSATPTVSGIAGDGTYYVRVRAAGATSGPASFPTNEIALVVGCTSPPSSPPLGLAAQVTGDTVTLSWNRPPFSTLSRYVLEAGSSPGATNVATLTLPASQTSIGGAIPNGTYFVRLRAENACGESAASSDVFVTIGSTSAIPAAPTGLSATTNGAVVGVQWTASAGAAGYVLEAGTAPGLSNIGVVPVAATNFIVNGVPPGIYHLRVRAANSAGISAPSAEFVLVVTP